MAMALLVVGLVMNAAGIALGSSRDLAALFRSLSGRIRSSLSALAAGVRSVWRRLRGKTPPGNVYSVGGIASVSASASGSALVWSGMPDGLSPEEAIGRLVSRTDALREMLAAEAKRHSDDVERISGDDRQFREAAEERFRALDERIDDFDVKPAGQRALGALLVLCGTVTMFAGGLLAG